jgi:hypothetical protein
VTATAGRRTARTGASSATGPIRGVHERLFDTGTIVPCRHEFVRLLFNQVSKQDQRVGEGQCTNSEHGLP